MQFDGFQIWLKSNCLVLVNCFVDFDNLVFFHEINDDQAIQSVRDRVIQILLESLLERPLNP